jgi:hypothetical protein
MPTERVMFELLSVSKDGPDFGLPIDLYIDFALHQVMIDQAHVNRYDVMDSSPIVR